MQTNGKWTDLIDEFMEYTTNRRSPEIYRLWSAITLVGGACQRRVWAVMGENVVWPILYTLLVGPPGTGKAIINDISALWTETRNVDGTRAFTLASRSVTKASLVDELSKADHTIVNNNKLKPSNYTYHSLLMASPEFEVIMPEYNSEMISFLNDIWDSRDTYTETRRHGPNKNTEIPFPHLCLLGGVQPAYFTAHFPDYAWNTGLIRRIMMIFADSPVKLNAEQRWNKVPYSVTTRSHLLTRLGQIAGMYKEVQWDIDAVATYNKWVDDGENPVPTHPKLEYYCTDRQQILAKLSLISAVSRCGADAVIEAFDVNRALLQWMLPAERRMPDIFRAMLGRSDGQIMNELHLYIVAKYQKEKKCVSNQDVARFMSLQTPADKVDKVIQLAQRAGMIIAVDGGGGWLPGRRNMGAFE